MSSKRLLPTNEIDSTDTGRMTDAYEDGVDVEAEVEPKEAQLKGGSRSSGLVAPAQCVEVPVPLAMDPEAEREWEARVVMFINPKSGGRRGRQAIDTFRSTLGCFVFDMAQVAKQNKEGLNEQLREALGVGARGSRVRARVVVGGGDGSVNWVMKLVRAAMGPHAAPCPLAVLPLGVGNELGRVTGWGHVCPNDLRAYLRSVLHASRIIHVDQWSVLITPDSDTDKEKANLRVQLEDEGHLSGGADVGVAARGAEDRKGAPLSPPSPPLPLSPFLLAARTRSLSTDSMGARPTLDSTNPLRATMSCFLSLGFDARIAYRFHVLRETHPEKCRTVEKNKLWHGLFGAQELFTRRPPVHRILRLRVDGAVVPLPSDIRTLQVFNIHSSADGTNFWGSAAPSARSPACGARCCAAGSEGDAAFRDPLIHDGLLEVCGTKGVAHLSRCHLGLSTAHRIAQGRDVRIDLLEPLEMQLDGEPWLQQPCSVHVTHRGTVPLLQGPHSLRNVDTASSVPAEAMT